MKRKSFLLLIPALLATSVAITSCENKDDPDKRNTIPFTATLNAGQAVPASNSTATGTFTGTYDKTSKVLSYSVTYSGITPTAAHIHQGVPGSSGPEDITLTNVGTSPITGTATLNQRQENDLIFGNYYVDLHTAQNPNSVIRGNIMMNRE